jgi:hypothetical protein
LAISAANFLVSIGEIELMSTTILPADSPEATPSAPNSTSATSGVSGTMTTMISDCSAIDLRVSQTVAPASLTGAGQVRLP